MHYYPFLKKYDSKIIGESSTANGPIEIYLFEVEKKKILFYMSPIGSSLAGTVMHEVSYISGATKFIVFGSCGVLDKEKCNGKLIVPTFSYRDEGLSYHYMEPSDYIKIKNSSKLAKIFEELHYPYVLGKSWTTDAIYMETVNKVSSRKKDGCISVEMESSGLQAICNYYGYELYTFFFGGDLLEGESLEKGKLGGDIEKDAQLEAFNIAIEILLNIY